MKTKQLERTAYHEAGHAVIAYSLKRKFRYVTIIPTDGYLGCVQPSMSGYKTFHPEYDSSSRTIKHIEHEVEIYLAGQIAEKMFSGKENWKCSSQDWSNATSMAGHACGNAEAEEAYTHLLWVETKAMMRLPWNWHAVKTLAKQLLIHHKIAYPRAKEIIDQAFEEWHSHPDWFDPATLDPYDVLAYWINDSTLVCHRCLLPIEFEEIKKNKQILRRSKVKAGEYYCSRCKKEILKTERR